MKVLSAMPPGRSREGLTLPQIRVLQVLVRAKKRNKGLLTRSKISEVIGNKTTVVVGRAIGYSDAQKRKKFEQTKDGGGAPGKPRPSLLTLGYVREIDINEVDLVETAVEVTAKGERAFAKYAGAKLPPLRD